MSGGRQLLLWDLGRDQLVGRYAHPGTVRAVACDWSAMQAQSLLPTPICFIC